MSIIARLEEIAALQAELKRRSMTYQYQLKCEVAAYYGLSFDEVDLPFVEWVSLREKYEEETCSSALTPDVRTVRT